MGCCVRYGEFHFIVLVWFGAQWSILLQHEDKLDGTLIFKANSERLQISIPEAGFEPADFSTKWYDATLDLGPCFEPSI